MSLKRLKKENPELTLNFVDILSEYDRTKTKKLTPFLVKMFKEKFLQKDDILRSQKSLLHEDESINFLENIRNNSNSFLDRIIKDLIVDQIGLDNMRKIHKIAGHLENKRLKNPDITSYPNWEYIANQISLADLTITNKKLSKDVEIIYKDDEWLIIKPLSFLSSLTYGSNTKWCTAMKSEPEYFYNLVKNSILIYALNKIHGDKFAFHSNTDSITVWNQVDNRIDSLQTSISYEILTKIMVSLDLNKNKTNLSMFSDEEISNMDKIYGAEKKVPDSFEHYVDTVEPH